ncbi:MAG: hypothetical protein Kow0062_20090 [Acidobacteriota bacterium]|nr:MAG: hypothetical protein D6738_07840 [Acidobacteriota bacterium]
MNRGTRRTSDDFFCWKYQVWYSMRDCVFRHGWATTETCAECEQGAANMRLLGPPPAPPRWTRLPELPGPRTRRR